MILPRTAPPKAASRRFFSYALLVPIAATLLARPAYAQTPGTANSSAFGESISLQVLPLLGSPIQVTSGPLPAVSGSAPLAYDLTRQLASVQVSVSPLGTLFQTGLLQVDAASPYPSSNVALADATVAAVRLRVGSVLPLDLGADAITSRALLTCVCVFTVPQVNASTSLANASLSGPLGINLGLSAHPAPNSVVVDDPGIRVVLNEQILTMNPDSDFAELTVNAVHISLNALPIAGLGLVTGEVVLAQSHASLTCPEPE